MLLASALNYKFIGIFHNTCLLASLRIRRIILITLAPPHKQHQYYLIQSWRNSPLLLILLQDPKNLFFGNIRICLHYLGRDNTGMLTKKSQNLTMKYDIIKD